MMCLVGNDFLPNLPNISIAEHGLELMFSVYQKHIKDLGGYIMDGSTPDIPRLVQFLGWLAEPDKEGGTGDTPDFSALDKLDSEEDLKAFDFDAYDEPEKDAHMMKVDGLDVLVMHEGDEEDEEKAEAARELGSGEKKNSETTLDYYNQPGAAMREPYYTSKLGREASLKNADFHFKMCKAYLDGISWVLRYYHDGVPSWEWFYPYHYAPYLAELSLTAPTWVPPVFPPSKPCRPLEQLLGVLPPQSHDLVPETYRFLMLSEQSPIISYYPKTFKTDLNGKRAEWEELVLIPFIETEKLRSAMKEAEKLFPLTEEELERDVLYDRVPCYTVADDGKEENHDVCIPTFMPGSFVIKTKISYIDIDYQSPHPQLLTSVLNISKFQPNPFIFPTLFCAPFHSIVKRVHVFLHSRPSNDESIVCVLDDFPPNVVENIEKALLGRTVLVGWPYFYPAVVESFVSREGVIDAASGGVMKEMTDGGKWFEQQLNDMSRDYLKRYAVALDKVNILVEVRPIAGMCEKLDGSCQRLYDNGSILVPLQTLCVDNPEADWQFYERPPCPQMLPIGIRAVAIHDGTLKLVEVAGPGEKPDTVRVYPCGRYDASINAELSSIITPAVKRGQKPYQGRWIPFHDLAVRCGLAHNYGALLALLDRAEFSPNRIQAGLGIVFRERISRNPGAPYGPPKVRYGWARYSKGENIFQSLSFCEGCEELIAEYKSKFPNVFNAIVKAEGRREEKNIGGRNGGAELHHASEWVKTLPHAMCPIIPAGSSLLLADVVEKCINVIEKTKPAVQDVADKDGAFDIPVTRLVRPHQVGVFPKTYIPAPAMSDNNLLRPLVIGDRVVNLLADGLIDFGAIGTVIAVKGAYCDVAFDRAHYGGSDLDTMCPDYHGATRHRIDVLVFPSSKRASRGKSRNAEVDKTFSSPF